ncbi:MAG: beta-propeller domain-containing protein [Myxococcales bacterium]|jgi:hypothetical protein
MNGALRLTCLLAAALLASCGGESKDDISQTESRLTAFQSCEELEAYIEDTAIREMEEMLDGQGGWGWFGGPGRAEDNATAPSAGNAPGQSSRPDHSETNTQVAGVDEADFVKTDGNRVFYLVGSRLFVIKSWPAEQTAIESETQIEGYPQEMFLAGNQLVIFSSVPRAYDPSLGIPGISADYWYAYWYWNASAVKVSVFDVSTNTPEPLRAWYLHGHYSSSRRIGSSVRLVLSADIQRPEYLWPAYDERGFLIDSAKDAAKAENARRIRARTLDEWLPSSYATESGHSVAVPRNCTAYHRPTAPTRLGLVTVATLNLANSGAAADMTAVIAQSGEVYASQEALYIATSDWWSSWTSSYEPRTHLHKFSLASPDRALYVASGSVPGYIVDQFSLDEHQGYLRVATTTWVDNGPFDPSTTVNGVFVLGEAEGTLQIVGRTPAIAEGERIFSSRFSGEKGFVVTYRQIDPLFTLDLADPTNPRVVGELHIPGFSTYIHLLDAEHLLTIGNDTTATATGETRNGVALQIFDVSDMANPRLTAKQVIGTQSGYSEALWDHKAFNYFAKTGMLAIPFTDWNESARGEAYWSYFTSTLKVFHVDAAGAVTPVGEVSHADFYQQRSQNDWYWWYGPNIRRSVQIEGFVYSFSYAGVKVNRVADLSAVAAVAMPPENLTQN